MAIKTFTKQTNPLTDHEIETARTVWVYITQADRWITNKEIRRRLKKEKNITVASPRVRKMINWMHMQGHLRNLVASSKGYKIAITLDELEDHAESLRGRIEAIEAREKQVLNDIHVWKQELKHRKIRWYDK